MKNEETTFQWIIWRKKDACSSFKGAENYSNSLPFLKAKCFEFHAASVAGLSCDGTCGAAISACGTGLGSDNPLWVATEASELPRLGHCNRVNKLCPADRLRPPGACIPCANSISSMWILAIDSSLSSQLVDCVSISTRQGRNGQAASPFLGLKEWGLDSG